MVSGLRLHHTAFRIFIINPGKDDNYRKSHGKKNDNKRGSPLWKAEWFSNIIDQLDDHESCTSILCNLVGKDIQMKSGYVSEESV